MQVSASVDAYEPESATLHLDRGRCEQFEAITAAASEFGFGGHGYFLDPPLKAPAFLALSLTAFHGRIRPLNSLRRCQLIATHGLNAITRCSLDPSGIRSTPDVVYATNVRTMQTVPLSGRDAGPYRIN
jgi:hypothetical protein